MVKILITGSAGALGSALAAALREGGDLAPAWCGPVDVVALPRAELDVADGPAVRARVRAERPAVIVNCAACGDPEACEADRRRAFAVNAEGPGHLASAAADTGACLVHVSTDLIFDGRGGRPYVEEDTPKPVCVCGASRLAGEANVRARARDVLLVRAGRIFGGADRDFVRGVLERARAAPRVEIPAGPRASPAYAPDLARAVLHLLREGHRGVFHSADEGACTWMEWAREILLAAGLTRDLAPAPAALRGPVVPFPADRSLDCGRLDATGFARRTWQEATRERVTILRRRNGGNPDVEYRNPNEFQMSNC